VALTTRNDERGRAETVIPASEKRKVGSSILPLTTILTCVDVHLVIVKVQLVTSVVSFLGQLLQADGRA